MNPESVSVVIASYNSAGFLPLAIQSVLNQTYSDFCIYIVDDGSTDNTKEVIEPFLKPGVCEYIYQTNGGQASAKNKGAYTARGPLVAFLDADDMWIPSKLEKQLPLFINTAIGVTFTGVVGIDQSGTPLENHVGPEKQYRGKVLEKLFFSNFLPFSSTIVRKSVFEEVGGFDESLGMGIDWDLWLRASLLCEFDFTEEPALLYRVWSGQMSSNFLGRYDGAFNIMNKFLKKHPDVIHPRVVRNAYAQTFANLGYTRNFTGQDTLGALRDIRQSLRIHPTRTQTWKTLLAIVINRPWSTTPPDRPG